MADEGTYYQEVGKGNCRDNDDLAFAGFRSGNPASVLECAQFCRSYPNKQFHVGIQYVVPNVCYCLYDSVGQVPSGIQDVTYFNGNGGSGTVSSSNLATGDCYAHLGYSGYQVEVSPLGQQLSPSTYIYVHLSMKLMHFLYLSRLEATLRGPLVLIPSLEISLLKMMAMSWY